MGEAASFVVSTVVSSQPMEDILQGFNPLILIGPESDQDQVFTPRGGITMGLRILGDIEKGVKTNGELRRSREAVCTDNSWSMYLSERGLALWEEEVRKCKCWDDLFNQCWARHVRDSWSRNVDPGSPEDWSYKFRAGLSG